MEVKKTGKLFSFCCVVPTILKNKKNKMINSFEKIGFDIGLLFQIADDLIDYEGKSKMAGKKTKKDKKKGKATLISLLGHKNTIKYSYKIKSKIIRNLKKYRSNTKNIEETLDYILTRSR